MEEKEIDAQKHEVLNARVKKRSAAGLVGFIDMFDMVLETAIIHAFVHAVQWQFGMYTWPSKKASIGTPRSPPKSNFFLNFPET